MIKLQVGSAVLENVDLVIFDKDGTLMDLYTYWANMVGYRVELAKHKFGFSDKDKTKIMYAMGVDCANKRLRKNGPVGIKSRETVMAAMEDSLSAIGFSDTHDLCFDIFREADKASLKNFAEIVKPIDGMHDLINALNERRCRIAIATTDKTERAALAVKHLKIFDKIDVIVGADMVKNCKPYPDMVNLILDKLSIDKSSAVMVGDAVTDIEMGNNAQLKASVAVCSGIASKEQLLEKTRYVIQDISKLAVI